MHCIVTALLYQCISLIYYKVCYLSQEVSVLIIHVHVICGPLCLYLLSYPCLYIPMGPCTHVWPHLSVYPCICVCLSVSLSVYVCVRTCLCDIDMAISTEYNSITDTRIWFFCTFSLPSSQSAVYDSETLLCLKEIFPQYFGMCNISATPPGFWNRLV